MTPDAFSALARGFGSGVQPRAFFETVQFRVGGKTFATLGWPESGWAVIKVAPSRQAWALSLSEGLAPEPGRRRRAGIVLARLSAVDEAVVVELLAEALSFAHQAAPPRARKAVPSGLARSAAA